MGFITPSHDLPRLRARGDRDRATGRYRLGRVFRALHRCGALKILPLSLAANAVHFVVAVVQFQFLGSVNRLIAYALPPLAAPGCVIEGAWMIQRSDQPPHFTRIAV